MATDWPELGSVGPAGEPASFRGVPGHILYGHDDQGHDLATFARPHRKGAEVEDQGRGVMRFELTFVFWGETYANLTSFLQACGETGPGEFIHPLLGTYPQVVVGRLGHRYGAERRRYSEVDVELVVHEPEGASAPLFPTWTPAGRARAAYEAVEEVKDAGRNRVEEMAKEGRDGSLAARDSARTAMREAMAKARRLLGVIPLPAAALDWLHEPLDWCEAVDLIVQGRLRTLMAGPGGYDSAAALFRADLAVLVDETVRLVGASAGVETGVLVDYVQLSAAAGLTLAAGEVIQGGLAVEAGIRFDGPYLDLEVTARVD